MTIWEWPTAQTYRRAAKLQAWLSRWHLRQSRKHEARARAYWWCAECCAKEILDEVAKAESR